MNAIKRSWSLFKSTLAVLNADKEMIWYPILASVITLIATVMLLGSVLAVLAASPAAQQAVSDAARALDDGEASPVQTVGFFLTLFVYYLVMYFIANFFMTGLAGAALIRFEGGDPTFGDGMRVARRRVGAIFGYSMIAATVGVLLSALRNRSSDSGNAGGALLAGMGGFAWNVVTFLVIPIIAAEELSPIGAIKESASKLRHTWGEQLAGSAGLGALFGLLIVVVLFVFGGLIVLAIDTLWLVITLAALAVLLIAVLAVINNTLNGIYRAAVYRYAASKEVAPQFDPALIETAFAAK